MRLVFSGSALLYVHCCLQTGQNNNHFLDSPASAKIMANSPYYAVLTIFFAWVSELLKIKKTTLPKNFEKKLNIFFGQGGLGYELYSNDDCPVDCFCSEDYLHNLDSWKWVEPNVHADESDPEHERFNPFTEHNEVT